MGLPASVKAKITFSGSNFKQVLQDVVPDTHPYLKYMIDVQRNPKIKVPFPASAPYVARHLQGASFSPGQLKIPVGPQVSQDTDETGSVGSTMASNTEIFKLQSKEETVYFDCREEEVEDEAFLPALLTRSPPTRSIWNPFFCCSCARKA